MMMMIIIIIILVVVEVVVVVVVIVVVVVVVVVVIIVVVVFVIVEVLTKNNSNSTNHPCSLDVNFEVIAETAPWTIENVLPHCDVRCACVRQSQSHYSDTGPIRLNT
ncbi:hypothetical protein ElyMa_002139000 [Elysia marginata]|uniref:Uncharacterized protein n=1 Tax=Elysia marginata TaxID=1093978 RepID=A0AAV4FKY1_9GAST|nr:hypothetical protein ElyMa_002139000 [Elysia marginata]